MENILLRSFRTKKLFFLFIISLVPKTERMGVNPQTSFALFPMLILPRLPACLGGKKQQICGALLRCLRSHVQNRFRKICNRIVRSWEIGLEGMLPPTLRQTPNRERLHQSFAPHVVAISGKTSLGVVHLGALVSYRSAPAVRHGDK